MYSVPTLLNGKHLKLVGNTRILVVDYQDNVVLPFQHHYDLKFTFSSQTNSFMHIVSDHKS